jgi:carbamate kinase
MIVITLGGNAILPGHGKGTIQEQFAVATEAMAGVAEVIASGQPVVLSHGNGPIVGNIAIRNEAAKDRVPPMPLDVCGADSQGGIGYMLQQVLDNELGKRGIRRTVVSLVTQCVVNEDDPAFDNPTKSIGPFYTEEESVYLARTKSWRLVEDSGRGYRRVVPSPIPREIVEWEAIRALVDAGIVVIAAGGGGIPVVRRDGRLSGVEAVIDKDRASAVLASQLSAERLVVLTAVARVAVDFGRPTQRDLDRIEVTEARRMLREGQFPPWSMGPKIEACADFVEAGGREAIITSPENLTSALAHESGTRVVPDGAP